MTTLECVPCLDKPALMLEVHPCQEEAKQTGYMKTLQALLLLVSCTLKRSEEERPVEFNREFKPLVALVRKDSCEVLVPKYQRKLGALGLCRSKQTHSAFERTPTLI